MGPRKTPSLTSREERQGHPIDVNDMGKAGAQLKGYLQKVDNKTLKQEDLSIVIDFVLVMAKKGKLSERQQANYDLASTIIDRYQNELYQSKKDHTSGVGVSRETVSPPEPGPEGIQKISEYIGMMKDGDVLTINGEQFSGRQIMNELQGGILQPEEVVGAIDAIIQKEEQMIRIFRYLKANKEKLLHVGDKDLTSKDVRSKLQEGSLMPEEVLSAINE